MITIGNDKIDIGNFPDGSMLVKYQDSFFGTLFPTTITWRYENDREFLCLIYLVKHLQSHGVKEIYLSMPYIPNARQDRVKNREDVFTLKYFAEVLNSLNFTEVSVLDPHSSVSEALINNIRVRTPEHYIDQALCNINSDNIMLFYPDEGCMKRRADSTKLPYAFGIKKRNWKTGAIEGLDVAGEVDKIAGKNILIVDDICSRGGTFLHSAQKLKELGANDIYLYVSHCENTILEGNLLSYNGLIKKVYTTDSIFTKSHEKIEVLK